MRIVLNVGGTRFETSTTTLERHTKSFFTGLIRTVAEGDVLFIDRDPTHFRHILNHLRSAPTLPTDPTGLRELRIEADFFCLADLVAHIDSNMSDVTRRTITHMLDVIATRMGG